VRPHVFAGEKWQRHARHSDFHLLQPHSTGVPGQLGAMSQQQLALDVLVLLIAMMMAAARHKRLSAK
jgi:hypothetical protein